MEFKNLEGLNDLKVDETNDNWPDACSVSDLEMDTLAEAFEVEMKEILEKVDAIPGDGKISNLPYLIRVLEKLTPKQALCMLGVGIGSIFQDAIDNHVERQEALDIAREKLQQLKDLYGKDFLEGIKINR